MLCGNGAFATRVIVVATPILVGIIAVLALLFARRKGETRRLVVFALIGFGIGLLGLHGLVNQVQGHRIITTLNPNDLQSFTISGRVFEDPQSVKSITDALRSSQWFLGSHTKISDTGEIQIRRKTGEIVRFQIGRINQGTDLEIYNDETFRDVNTELSGLLKNLPSSSP